MKESEMAEKFLNDTKNAWRDETGIGKILNCKENYSKVKSPENPLKWENPREKFWKQKINIRHDGKCWEDFKMSGKIMDTRKKNPKAPYKNFEISVFFSS